MRKIFVLDTNVLLHSAHGPLAFGDNEVVLPMAVIEELDRFKKRHDELGRNARQVIRLLDDLRKQGQLGTGVTMDNGGRLRILTGKGQRPDPHLDMDLPDNRILQVAWRLHQEGGRVIFVSKDINARIKADALSIEAQDFESGKVQADELYPGWRRLRVSAELIDEFFQSDILQLRGHFLRPNEFVLLENETNPKHTALARAMKDDSLVHLVGERERCWNVRSRSMPQRAALELLLDPDVACVTLVGRAGTGKTLLALAAGLECTVNQKRYDKILASRPIVPLGKDIGYLPGAKDQKLSHWMQPIFDNLTYLLSTRGTHLVHAESRTPEQHVDKLVDEGKLVLEPLTYIRGRSIPNQYIIVDEAQNLTPLELKTVITRAGNGTKIVLTGDPYQIDHPYLDSKSNGLTYVVERFKGRELFGHVMFRKGERSPLAELAADLM